MPNSLIHALSPYLRQHADNPVAWQEWSADAFDEAKRRDVPVLLSVGYAACHWCHVMAHESFENAEIAEAINERYVSIKVDREERPDIDAVYMAATQALTGHGGWPMTVFLTPEGAPLYAGTYFPPAQFLHIVKAVAEIWRDDRERAQATGQTIVDALSAAQGTRPSSPQNPVLSITTDDLSAVVATLRREFDDARAGFGGAPKFPPSMTMEHLLRHHARTGHRDALAMVQRTAEAMARGGMYDQLDGGFARYSVDASWIVPHFEKMLYDNAQLLRVYTHLAQRGDALAHRIATETAEFLLNRLVTQDGGFASSLDADAAGAEGTTYVWTPQQLIDVLGPLDGARVARLLSVGKVGSFEGAASTLQLPRDPQDVFTAHELRQSTMEWWRAQRAQLAAARDARPQPERDDKVVTAWNGLAIAGLAEAAKVLGRPEWLSAAERAARFVVETHEVDGRLRRASLDGEVSTALAGADDYGDFAEGLLVLHQATGNAEWLATGLRLLEVAAELFIEGDHVFDTGHDAEALFLRPTSTGDNAEPSGASALASAFVMAWALTGDSAYRELAGTCLAQLDDVARQAPRFAGWAWATREALAAGPMQVALVTSEAGRTIAARKEQALEQQAMEELLWTATAPGLVRVVGTPDQPGMPLLAHRPAVDGKPTAYVCRGFACDAPITDPEQLAPALR